MMLSKRGFSSPEVIEASDGFGECLLPSIRAVR
jgi:hypothetical protein